jgi:hypothetical protein
MIRFGPSIVVACFVSGAIPAWAQSPLPLVPDVDAKALRRQCERLLPLIISQLSPDDGTALTRLARTKDRIPDDFAEQVQKVLDRHCLIGVNINPESRVKAARGPRVCELEKDAETFVLVKVQNDAGVTQGLKVSGDQLRTSKEKEEGRWLEAAIYAEKPMDRKLSGQKLEYVILRLKAHEAGKREATLKFDVGQGTQDLGFRAEVPVLFTVRAAKR